MPTQTHHNPNTSPRRQQLGPRVQVSTQRPRLRRSHQPKGKTEKHISVSNSHSLLKEGKTIKQKQNKSKQEKNPHQAMLTNLWALQQSAGKHFVKCFLHLSVNEGKMGQPGQSGAGRDPAEKYQAPHTPHKLTPPLHENTNQGIYYHRVSVRHCS